MRTLTRTTTDTTHQLDELGYAHIRGALPVDQVADLVDAVNAVWDRYRPEPPHRGAAPLHLLAFLREDRRFIDLLDRAPVLRAITTALGPNIFMYHCHLDVHPPEEDVPTRWMWHQDGGIQNRDLETDPRPRLSLKVAYFLTDLTEPGRGNFVVLPGSHLRNEIVRPATDVAVLPGATPILAAPGDAVIFDRRLWHMRSPNRSTRTRKALFFAYTYRWIRPRDDLGLDRETIARLTPAQRQLAGVDDTDAIDRWMPDRTTLPISDVVPGDRR
jgi:ectoine hydroxylase